MCASNPGWTLGFVPTPAQWNSEFALKADDALTVNTIGTIALLRANTAVANQIFLAGYTTPVDGGEGTFVSVASDTTSADNGGTIIVDGSARRWHRATSGQICSAKWFGAKGDGSTNDTAAIASAFAAFSEVMLPPSTYVIGSNLTVANGKKLRLTDGAILQISGGVTLAITGQLDAPIAQIFTGTGSAVGMRTAYPEWWGAQPDNSGFDSQPALQKAHTAIQASFTSDGGRPTIVLGPGIYSVGNTWTLAPTFNCPLIVQGQGTTADGSRIQTNSSFPSAPVMFLQGNSDSIQQTCDWALIGFAVVWGGGSPTIAIKVGSDNDSVSWLMGLQENLIENVNVSTAARGFSIGMQFCHARLITMRRCSVWLGVGASGNASDARTCIKFTENGWFCGDITMYNVQIVGTANTGVIGFELNSTVASSLANAIAGIRFNGCIGYTCDMYVKIFAQNGKGVSDIWLNPGCQFDGGSIHGIYMQADGAGSFLQNIHIDGVYVDGTNPGDMINVLISNSGFMQDIWVVNCWLSQPASRAVAAGLLAGTNIGLFGLHIEGNEINSCSNTGGEAIFLGSGVTDCICTHNVASRSAFQSFTNFITIGNGSLFTIVTENCGSGVPTGSVINDLSGGVTKVVTNNI